MSKINIIAFVLTLLFLILQVEIIVFTADNLDFVSQIIENETEAEKNAEQKLSESDQIISKIDFYIFGFDNSSSLLTTSVNKYFFHFLNLPDIPPEFDIIS